MAVAELKELKEKLSDANKMNGSGRLSMIARRDARNGYPICNKDFATVEKLWASYEETLLLLANADFEIESLKRYD
ncbi:hypothetical protein BYT27DRAFT_7261524 [Phlegmacium glaucopus]|nr:hypothetical protein BYT27DRAFT_7261524 [Phlegmacium glaucopus]